MSAWHHHTPAKGSERGGCFCVKMEALLDRVQQKLQEYGSLRLRKPSNNTLVYIHLFLYNYVFEKLKPLFHLYGS